MKISVFVYGSRGDVQPMLALALELRKRRHEILLIANPENEALVTGFDIPFVPFGPNVREQMAINAKNKTSPLRASMSSFKEFKKITGTQITDLPGIIDGTDLVLNAGMGLGVHTVADIKGIPYRFVIFYPMLLGTGNPRSLPSRIKAALMNAGGNAMLKGLLNQARKEAGVEPLTVVSKSWLGDHVYVAAEPALNRVNERTLATYTQTGYMFLDAGTGLPGVVNEFIAAGPPPFFIGFGSNPIYYPEELAHMFRRIASQTGRRLIVSKGWAGLESSDQAEDILYVDDVPYELLFPKMAAVIHHGGTGTMAYAARAGVPQAAFPYMADQFTNRKRIFELGIGPKTCDFRKMDEKAIVEAINACVSTDSYRNNATTLAETIRTTEGTKQTADLIEKEFGRKPDSLNS